MGRFDIEQLLRELDESCTDNTSAPIDQPIPTSVDSPDGEHPSPGDDALHELYVPDESEPSGDRNLLDLLASGGLVDAEVIDSARRIMEQSPDRSGESILLQLGVDESVVQSAIAGVARIDFVRVDLEQVDEQGVMRLGRDFCRERQVIPLQSEGVRSIVATTSTDDVFLLDEVKRRLGVSVVKHVLVTAGDIDAALEHIDRRMSQDVDVEAILADVDEDDVEVETVEEDGADLEAEAESSPVVRYVNHIIQTALKEGASDIHIEPGEKSLQVRLRIDGVLFESMAPPRKMHAAITSRVKIMANLDIAERRLPQDGRIRATVMGRTIDLRVSTVPTPYGEKTVMRILDDRAIQVSLGDLGFAENTLESWKSQVRQPHGIILVTGPTGSGKTTTLYSSIRQMDTKRLNVSTVEDPVEYNLSGITQIQTHAQIDMTFARALKALLRQDPDVVMVGEIRDQETATTAVQAALTGHLVLSTLHTNDAPSSVTRLINIGVEPFLVGAALNGVLAQRLVRRICGECRTDMAVPEELRPMLDAHGITSSTLPCGAGCEACRNTGYSGRLGIYELLELDDHLRDLVSGSPNVTEFRRTCCERGMVTLRADGFQKVRDGLTTVEEVLRVTESDG